MNAKTETLPVCMMGETWNFASVHCWQNLTTIDGQLGIIFPTLWQVEWCTLSEILTWSNRDCRSDINMHTKNLFLWSKIKWPVLAVTFYRHHPIPNSATVPHKSLLLSYFLLVETNEGTRPPPPPRGGKEHICHQQESKETWVPPPVSGLAHHILQLHQAWR